jgi:hypothetical protein
MTAGYEEDSLRCTLERVFGGLKADRDAYIDVWRQLADNFQPFRGRWLNERPNQKIRRNLAIINETPIFARRTFGAGMQVGTTSQSRPWFHLQTAADQLMEEDGVREWLYDVETEMRNMLAQSNFYGEIRMAYEEYGTFGNMALAEFDDEYNDDNESGLHFCAYTIGSYYFARNAKGVVDTFGCEFKWTVRQIVQKWVKDPKNPNDPGWTNITPETKSAWFDKSRREVMVDIVYLVMPNNARVKGRLDASGMPFMACYYEANKGAGERVLETKGFREFPIHCASLAVNQGDSYGNGLALDVLGSAKALQLQERRKAQVIDKEVDPPMRANPSLQKQKTSQLPGDVTFVAAGTGQLGFEPVAQWKPDRSGMLEDIAGTESRINTGMFADIFALFIQGEDDPDETATKTAAKQQEKLMMLGPVVESANAMLKGVVNRTFMIGLRQGRFAEPPEALAGAALKIEHVSILAMAQNIAAVQGINQFTGFVLGLATQQVEAGQAPTALDKLDVDQTVDEYAKLSGVVPTIVVPDARVAEIRDQRAKQQAQQQQAEQAMMVAKEGSAAAKNLSQAKLGQDSALDAVANA